MININKKILKITVGIFIFSFIILSILGIMGLISAYWFIAIALVMFLIGLIFFVVYNLTRHNDIVFEKSQLGVNEAKKKYRELIKDEYDDYINWTREKLMNLGDKYKSPILWLHGYGEISKQWYDIIVNLANPDPIILIGADKNEIKEVMYGLISNPPIEHKVITKITKPDGTIEEKSEDIMED